MAKKKQSGQVEEVLKHYMIAALWSTTDPDTDENLDDNYGIEDIAPKTKAQMKKDVTKFLKENKSALSDSGLSDEQIGHDFWLSRNGHGAGFFDRSLDKDVEDKLMDSSRKFKGIDLYVGDDKKIHSMTAYKKGGNASDAIYYVTYYAKVGEHGELQYKSSNFDAVYREAMDFYKRTKKENGLGSDITYIGVEGSGSGADKFAVVYIDESYLKNTDEKHFGDSSNFKVWEKVAKSSLESGKAKKGSYGKKEKKQKYIVFYSSKETGGMREKSFDSESEASDFAKEVGGSVTPIKLAKGGSTSDDAPRIYVADLAAYNEGKLIGEWLDLADYSDGADVMEAISDLLKKWSKEQGEEREEYAIHDHEGIPPSLYSEGMGESTFDEIISTFEVAKDNNVPIEVVLKWVAEGHDADSFGDAYRGKYDTFRDFAEQEVDEIGLENFNNPSFYADISETDRRIMAGEQGDSYADDIRDEDGGKRLIEEAGMSVTDYTMAAHDDDEDAQEKMLDEAREIVSSKIYDEWYEGLKDPVDFLVNQQGIYTEEDLMKAGFMRIDYDLLARDLEHDYTTFDYKGDVYVFMSNYAKGGKIAKVVTDVLDFPKVDNTVFGKEFVDIFGV